MAVHTITPPDGTRDVFRSGRRLASTGRRGTHRRGRSSFRARDPRVHGIREAERLLPLLEAGLPEDAPRPIDPTYLAAVVPLEQERLKRLSEAPDLLSFFFVEQPRYNPMRIIRKGMARDGAREAIDRALKTAEALGEWDAPSLERTYRALADELGLTSGQLFGALRVAVTGREAAPPLFDTMAVLGKQRVLARLRAADGFLGAMPVAC